MGVTGTPTRPGGITAVSLFDLAFGVLMYIISAVVSPFSAGGVFLILIGSFALVMALGTWRGASWTWYVLTMGGGLYAWYFARDDVKEFFGIRDENDERAPPGD